MSLVQILFNKLAGNPLLITSGVISSSYFLAGNLGAAYFGIVPAIQDPHGVDLPVATKVELWKWYLDRAQVMAAWFFSLPRFLINKLQVHMPASIIVSTISFSAAAYLSSSPPLRNLLLCTTGLSFAFFPFTAITMLPINNELIAMHNARSLHASTKMTSHEHALLEKRATNQLMRWNELHRVRMVLGMVVWITGFAAFVISL